MGVIARSAGLTGRQSLDDLKPKLKLSFLVSSNLLHVEWPSNPTLAAFACDFKVTFIN